MEAKDLLGKKLLIVVAHPDDETFLAAGLMDRNREAGGTNSIICATYGEQGRSHMKKQVTDMELKQIRKRELEKVSKFLSVRSLYGLELPDAGLRAKGSILQKKIEKIAKIEQVDFIVNFGPDGFSGHLDHIAIGAASKKCAKNLSIPFVAFAASPEFVQHFAAVQLRRMHGVYAKKTKHHAHAMRLKINAKLKQKAFGIHKSQCTEGGMLAAFPSELQKQFLNYEYFR